MKTRVILSLVACCFAVNGCSRTQSLLPASGVPNMALASGEVATAEDPGGFQVLHSFGRFYYSDPSGPFATLTAVNGKLYGTTVGGGSATMGAVYSMTSSGKVATVYAFGFDSGGEPFAPLLYLNGSFYGTTYVGGQDGSGTVYRLDMDGKFKTLHAFQGGLYDGAGPQAGLVRLNGIFYGTTFQGGAANDGVVFSIDGKARERILHSFEGADGDGPIGGLVALNGTLYGTTPAGGLHDAGTVFSISPSGKEQTVYDFRGGSDGYFPVDVLRVVKGTLYGATQFGGKGYGTVFKVTITGNEQVLYRFNGTTSCYPASGLSYLRGLLYGTTYGAFPSSKCSSFGTVYRVTLDGKVTTLHEFAGGAKGENPVSGLTYLGGKLYGTTENGGDYAEGTAYSLNP